MSIIMSIAMTLIFRNNPVGLHIGNEGEVQSLHFPCLLKAQI